MRHKKLFPESKHTQESGAVGKAPLANAAALLKDLLSPSLRRSTLILWLVFFANAFTYYGELVIWKYILCCS